jgi:leucyl-tRNA synthetase
VHVLGQGQRDGSTVVADRLQRLQTGSKRISDGIIQALDGPILEQLALGSDIAAKWLEGRAPSRVIVVPGKLVNLVP